MTSCTTCGAPLAPVPPPPGLLAMTWGHAVPPADGHLPGVPPVTVIYQRDGDAWVAHCPEVPGLAVNGARTRYEAQSVAWALLGKLSPPRPVIERDDDA